LSHVSSPHGPHDPHDPHAISNPHGNLACAVDAHRVVFIETDENTLTPAKLDHPSDHCEFGEHGWVNEDVNVLTAIMNQTARLMNGEG